MIDMKIDSIQQMKEINFNPEKRSNLYINII